MPVKHIRIKAADEWLSTRPRNEAIHIFVAWHVITGINVQATIAIRVFTIVRSY